MNPLDPDRVEDGAFRHRALAHVRLPGSLLSFPQNIDGAFVTAVVREAARQHGAPVNIRFEDMPPFTPEDD